MPVTCKICNREFKKQITNSHLKTHDTTTAEYKEAYGSDSLSSDEYRLERKEALSGDRNPNFGKHWTEEQKSNLSKTKKQQGNTAWNKGLSKTDYTPEYQTSIDQGISKRESRYEDGTMSRPTQYERTDEIKDKIAKGVSQYAKDHQEEISSRGKKAVETKRKNGHEVAFFKGKKHSDDTKRIISEKSKKHALEKRKQSIESTKDRLKNTPLTVIGSWDEHFLTIKCNDCGETFKHTRQMLTESKFYDTICKVCHPIETGRSKGEIELFDFVSSICPDAIPNYLYLIRGEIDIYVPSKGVCIEYNGLYYHSSDVLESVGKSKTADFEKHQKVTKKGYRHIVIFEDEWLNEKDKVKSRLSHILGDVKDRIYARKCVLREVSSKDSGEFNKLYHIQGNGRSNARYGLYYEDQLVALMTFSKNNISRKINTWEINRYCTISGKAIVGGASRLFKKFIRDHDPKEVITYADTRWSNGDLYQTLGFKFDKNTVPNYWYVYKGTLKRIHRYTLRKTKNDPSDVTEKVLRKREGYNIIYDCGSSKWRWEK